MKKLVFLFAFVLMGLGLQAQATTAIDKIAEQDLKVIEIKITKNYPNLKFNKSQKQRLTTVLTKRATEVAELRRQETVSKDEYYATYKEIEKKYEADIEAIFSPEQKTVYLRSVKPQVTKVR